MSSYGAANGSAKGNFLGHRRERGKVAIRGYQAISDFQKAF